MTLLALALVVAWGYALISGALGAPSFIWLERTPPAHSLPGLTVVLAARDEAGGVAACLTSLLASRHPDLAIIALDDRSSDGTGGIMDSLAGGRLQVVHVRGLPDGWLGKNHALWLGAGMAQTPWLLFTDGDVIFHPDAIARGQAWALARGLDHLAVAPELLGGGWLLKAVEGVFTTFFTSVTRVGRVASPNSSAAFGVGAFNLVRTEAYRAIGTHAAIALRPDDDVMLGRLVKQGGHRSAVGLGRGYVSVPWYRTLGEMARGFEKNALAPVGYRAWLGVLIGLLVLAAFAGPFLLLLTEARAIAALAAAMALALYLGVNRPAGVPAWTALLMPISGLILVVLYERAVILTAMRGEIRWRGRSYRLRDLR